jgi:hypothetical protein
VVIGNEAFMALQLRKPASKAALTLNGPRVIVAGAQRVAYFCQYPHGWWVYPLLTGSTGVAHNREPLRAAAPLQVGDSLTLLGGDWVVDALECTAEDVEAGAVDRQRTPCRIALDDGTELETESDLVIGSAAECGWQLPEATGAAPQHALLAFGEGQWHLHDLTGAGLTFSGEEERLLTIALQDRHVIRLGSVDLTIWLVSGQETTVDLPGAGSAGETTQLPAGSSAETEAGNTGMSHSVLVPGKDLDENRLYRTAWKLCQWVQKLIGDSSLPGRRPADAGVVMRQLIGTWSRPSDPFEALERFRARLAVAPTDRAGLMDLARYLEELGFLDLCRFVLKELYQLNRNDFEVVSTLAKLYFRQAHAPGCVGAERLSCLEHAEKYVARALALRPADKELLKLRQSTGAEWTTTKWKSMPGRPGSAPEVNE